MGEAITKYTVTRGDLIKDSTLKWLTIGSPILLSIIPAGLLFIFGFIFGTTPPIAATFFFLSLIAFFAGFFVGLAVAAGISFYRSRWLGTLREKIAADGISTDEVRWFNRELSTEEKRTLKTIESKDLLLGDAYRETLASRLTATRIIKSTSIELQLAKRRKNRLKSLKGSQATEYTTEIENDIQVLAEIKKEAEEMRTEAQSRLQIIDGAFRRGTGLAENEITLKKLSDRSKHLPLALETAKMQDEMHRTLVREIKLEFDDETLK